MTGALIVLGVAFIAQAGAWAWVTYRRDVAEREERAGLLARIQDPEAERVQRYVQTLTEIPDVPPPPPESEAPRSDADLLLAELTGADL